MPLSIHTHCTELRGASQGSPAKGPRVRAASEHTGADGHTPVAHPPCLPQLPVRCLACRLAAKGKEERQGMRVCVCVSTWEMTLGFQLSGSRIKPNTASITRQSPPPHKVTHWAVCEGEEEEEQEKGGNFKGTSRKEDRSSLCHPHAVGRERETQEKEAPAHHSRLGEGRDHFTHAKREQERQREKKGGEREVNTQPRLTCDTCVKSDTPPCFG